MLGLLILTGSRSHAFQRAWKRLTVAEQREIVSAWHLIVGVPGGLTPTEQAWLRRMLGERPTLTLLPGGDPAGAPAPGGGEGSDG